MKVAHLLSAHGIRSASRQPVRGVYSLRRSLSHCFRLREVNSATKRETSFSPIQDNFFPIRCVPRSQSAGKAPTSRNRLSRLLANLWAVTLFTSTLFQNQRRRIRCTTTRKRRPRWFETWSRNTCVFSHTSRTTSQWHYTTPIPTLCHWLSWRKSTSSIRSERKQLGRMGIQTRSLVRW